MASPWITTQDLTDYLGRDCHSAGGTIVVDAACDIVRARAEQTFTEVKGGTVTLDGSGTDVMLLPELPVTAAGTVLVNGGTVSDYTLNGYGMLIRGTEYGLRSFWPVGRQNVRVTYDHGFGTATFPRDVAMVSLQVASRLAIQGVAQFEAMGDQQIRYAVSATDLTAGEEAILAKYRRRG